MKMTYTKHTIAILLLLQIYFLIDAETKLPKPKFRYTCELRDKITKRKEVA